MKRLTATYTFDKKCDNKNYPRVYVTLIIDFQHNTYSIKPDNGTTDSHFRFIQSKEPLLWKTVLLLINEAIDFAEKELENRQ